MTRSPVRALLVALSLAPVAPLGCGGSSSSDGPIPVEPFGDAITMPRGLACIDSTHAAVATERAGLQIVRIEHPTATEVVATLPADERVDLDQAYFLRAPGRLYFLNRTVGMLHVIDTTNPDAPTEVGAVAGGVLGSVAGGANIVYETDAMGMVAVDMTAPASPTRGAPGKMFQRVQKFTPAAGTPIALIGDVLLALSGEQTEIYSFDVKNPMMPVEIGRLSLLDPDREASAKVVVNGWALRGTLLYLGATQLPAPPDITTPQIASLFVVDAGDPRAPRVVTYPNRRKPMARVLFNDAANGLFGIAGSGNAADTLQHVGIVVRFDLTDPNVPAPGRQIHFSESTLINYGAIHDACFAGDTLVVYESTKVAFAKLQ